MDEPSQRDQDPARSTWLRWLLRVRHPSVEVRRRGQTLIILLCVFAITASAFVPVLFALLPAGAGDVWVALAVVFVGSYLVGIVTTRLGFVDLTGAGISVLASALVAVGVSLSDTFHPFGWTMGLTVLIAAFSVRPVLLVPIYALVQLHLFLAKLYLEGGQVSAVLGDLDFLLMSFLLLVFAGTTGLQAYWIAEVFRGQLEARRAAIVARDDAQIARRDAVRASRAKSTFLANMSHELRTPLNAIIGYAEILDEGLDEADQEAREDLGRIRTAGRHLLGLINDVLDLAKIESGRVVLEYSTFALPPLVESTLEGVIPAARARGDHLDLVIAPEVGDVYSDPTRLRQILLNLLSNAVKFTESGRVTLEVRRTPDAFIEVLVSDTGIGIPEDRLESIFEAFEQADASTTRRFGGTGLGLAVSRQLAQLLGGSLVARSVVGEGSTFVLRFLEHAPPMKQPSESSLPRRQTTRAARETA